MIAIVSVEHGEGHGAEIVLENLLRGWNPSLPDLVVCAPKETRVLRTAREVDLRHHALLTTRNTIRDNLQGVLGLRNQLHDARIIHAWSARGFEGAALLAQRLGVAAAGTLHDHPKASFHGRIRRFIMRRSANRFAALACVSGPVRDACKQSGYQCPMSVLHNGLTELTRKPTGGGGEVHIGFLGMYAPWKGFHLVEPWIRALEHANVVWHLFGAPGPALQEQAERVQQELPDRVILEGNQDPRTIFDTVDLLVHASTGFDPLPTVLLEAARAGIPVVASLRGGSPEIVVPDETGFLFAPDDPAEGLACIQRLVDDASLRQRMGRAARHRFEQAFTVDGMVNRYAEFWRLLPEEKGP